MLDGAWKLRLCPGVTLHEIRRLRMLTNFFRIDLPFEDFDIQRLAYSEEQLWELRQKHNSICSFFRNEDWIYISPAVGTGFSLGQTVRLKVNKKPEIVESLIRHLLFRVFRDKLPDRLPLDFRPLRFYAKPEENNTLPENIRD